MNEEKLELLVRLKELDEQEVEIDNMRKKLRKDSKIIKNEKNEILKKLNK